MKKVFDKLTSLILLAVVAWLLLSWIEVLRYHANPGLEYSQYNLFTILCELAR